MEEEFEKRSQREPALLDDGARERAFEKAAQALWQQLAQEIHSDVEEFSRHASAAEFSQPTENELRVSRGPLSLVVRANITEHNIGYDYRSHDARTAAAPEGGIFSIRLSRYGRADIYSADERLNDEEARRVLLEPVLFPTDPGD